MSTKIEHLEKAVQILNCEIEGLGRAVGYLNREIEVLKARQEIHGPSLEDLVASLPEKLTAELPLCAECGHGWAEHDHDDENREYPCQDPACPCLDYRKFVVNGRIPTPPQFRSK